MILALDSSTPWLSIALASAEESFFRLTHYTKKDHSRWLIKHLSMLQKEIDWEKDLEAVLVGLGPGSFTGVKIANMVAKGIAYSVMKPWVVFLLWKLLLIEFLKVSPKIMRFSFL
jgi:tRNA threonylcarbamoyladenosine biosynthesis protein TsaB